MRAKNVGKNRRNNEQKSFLYSHGFRDQNMGEKNARNNLSLNTRIVRQKLLEKNFREKVQKKSFLYSHEYRDQKKGGKGALQYF